MRRSLRNTPASHNTETSAYVGEITLIGKAISLFPWLVLHIATSICSQAPAKHWFFQSASWVSKDCDRFVYLITSTTFPNLWSLKHGNKLRSKHRAVPLQRDQFQGLPRPAYYLRTNSSQQVNLVNVLFRFLQLSEWEEGKPMTRTRPSVSTII